MFTVEIFCIIIKNAWLNPACWLIEEEHLTIEIWENIFFCKCLRKIIRYIVAYFINSGLYLNVQFRK